MPANISLLYWLLLFTTALLCIVQVIQSLRKPSERMGLPLIVSLAFGYFYVFQAFYAVSELGDSLPAWAFELGQATALLTLMSFLLGWRLGRRPTLRRPVLHSRRSEFPAKGVYLAGLAGMCIGAGGSLAFFYSPDVKLSETSAYLYLAFHVSYPGALLCLQAAAHNRTYRSPLLLLPPLLLLMAAIVAPALIHARRGPIFPMVIVLLYGYTLAAAKKANALVLLGGLVGAGILMLLLVTIRDYSSPDGSWGSKFWELDVQKVLLTKATQLEDNEYIYHCAASATCWVTGMSDYGTGYLTLITHWIPRELWPDKPALGVGFLGADPLVHMPSVVGLSMTTGAATGGVAETYGHLGPFALALWFVFGWTCATLYNRSLGGSPLAQCSYVAVAASSHWLVSQGFAAAYVPAMVYLLVPYLTYSLVTIKRDG